MVVAAVVRRWSTVVAAASAALFIAILAFHGERPEPGLVNFRPGGVVADWPLAEVTTVAVGAGEARRSFHRLPTGGWADDAAPTAAPVTEAIETGLKLLHNSPPERWLAADEIGDRPLAEFGLAPPRLAVTVRRASGGSITVYFGGPNPLGLTRYARIDGRPGIALLPAFVAESWERVAAER